METIITHKEFETRMVKDGGDILTRLETTNLKKIG